MTRENNRGHASIFEIFSFIGSLCSIVALLIVLCSELNLEKTVLIVTSALVSIGLTGFIYQGVYNLYKTLTFDKEISRLGHLFFLTIGALVGITSYLIVFMTSYFVIDFIKFLIISAIDTVTR